MFKLIEKTKEISHCYKKMNKTTWKLIRFLASISPMLDLRTYDQPCILEMVVGRSPKKIESGHAQDLCLTSKILWLYFLLFLPSHSLLKKLQSWSRTKFILKIICILSSKLNNNNKIKLTVKIYSSLKWSSNIYL